MTSSGRGRNACQRLASMTTVRYSRVGALTNCDIGHALVARRMASKLWVRAPEMLCRAMPPDVRATESLLAFWADAGVDVALAETPQNRMAAGLEALRPKPAAPATP